MLAVVIIMGMYDSFFYKNNELQLKNGECALNEFHIGDKVAEFGYEDGVYIDTTGKGVVVIWDGIYVAGFDKECMVDKWGNKLDFNRVAQCHK